MTENIKEKVCTECHRLSENTIYSAKGHFNASSLWSLTYWAIGISLTICSSIVGAESLNISCGVTKYLSLGVVVLAPLLTFLNPSDKAAKHKNAGSEYLRLSNQIRFFREMETDMINEEMAISRLKCMSEKCNDLSTNSPSIPFISYIFAKWGIKRGQAAYSIDDGKLS